MFLHIQSATAGSSETGPNLYSARQCCELKGRRKMQKVSKRSFCKNGGNNPNKCLGLTVSRFVGLHDVNETWLKNHSLWNFVNLIVCYHSDNNQINAQSRWCEVWWYLCTILEDPHHASNWAVSCWYFDYIDSFSTFTSKQHISELERKIGRKYSGRPFYAKILCRIKWYKL